MDDLSEEELIEYYGRPPFYNDKEMYMPDKRKYTEILRDLDARMVEYNVTIKYIENHLGNIDSHMGKINDTNFDQEVKIARNKDRIGLLYKIGGGFAIIIVTSIVAWIIKLPEIITARLQSLW